MAINSLASVRFPTYHLIEHIVKSEYNALSAGNKEKIKMILSCGHINMGEGSAIREDIFNMFPEGTETYTNLMQILNHVPSPGP